LNVVIQTLWRLDGFKLLLFELLEIQDESKKGIWKSLSELFNEILNNSSGTPQTFSVNKLRADLYQATINFGIFELNSKCDASEAFLYILENLHE